MTAEHATRPLRRNDIVTRTDHDFFAFYGRVSRIIDEETVEVAWGKDGIRKEPRALLQCHNEYRGYVDTRRERSVFRRMPTLRRLKQEAISWERGAWARNRARFAAEQAWDMDDLDEDRI